MNTPTKTTMAMLGGAATLAITVGFGGLGASPVSDPSPSMAPGAASPAGSGAVHIATLAGCISGANC
jgi:hypothetical protein